LHNSVLLGIISKENLVGEKNMLYPKALPPVGFDIRHLLWLCGGKDLVARACGISRLQWTVVPDKHVATVAKLAHLPIETIRPDLAPVAELFRAKEALEAAA
jgi:hypothetical protein